MHPFASPNETDCWKGVKMLPIGTRIKFRWNTYNQIAHVRTGTIIDYVHGSYTVIPNDEDGMSNRMGVTTQMIIEVL